MLNFSNNVNRIYRHELATPHQDEAQYRVKVRGELWSANSRDDLKPDETVKVLSVKRFTLVVGKNTAEQPSSRAKPLEQHT